MINVTSALFASSLKQLAAYKSSLGSDARGRFLQLFLGLKFYQNEVPSMFSGSFVSTEVVQTLLDDLYAKASRPLNACVLMLLEGTFLARTGVIGVGNTTAQNTWRNNLNLQKGIGCYAPPSDLSSKTFLHQSRLQCKYLSPVVAGELAGATCSLAVDSPRYRNEDHRKWLRIETAGGAYAAVDFNDTTNFAPYVAPGGKKVPLVPLIGALYFDATPGLSIASRTAVDIAAFASDFNMSASELSSYFDAAATNPYNAAILAAFAGFSIGAPPTATPISAPPAVSPTLKKKKKPSTIPAPVLSGTQVTPPTTNSGWEAEQFVAKAMTASGWTVYDVSRQRLGYDLLAKRGVVTRYVDVKSSVGSCSPTMTLREWQQAKVHGPAYVLAIAENFNPLGVNAIFWVLDPTNSCAASPATTTQYAISRTSWRAAVIDIADL
ncbi:MAG: protein NO VEIN domain-containing protein [Pseudomonadota bacterium]